MSRHRSAALVLLAAALYFLSFPPFPTGFLAALFLVPLFWALEGGGFRRGFRLGYAAGLLSIGGLLYWLSLNKGSSLGEAVAMHAGTAIYLAFAWGAFGLLLAFLGRRFGRAGLWAAPPLWTAMEFVQAHGSLGFTWHSLATTQATCTPAVQIASATGMFGLSFWLVLLNVLAYRAARAFLEAERPRWRGPAPRFAGIAIAVAAAPILYGLIAAPPAAGGGRMRVAVIQPNDDSRGKWTRRNLAYQHLMKLTLAAEGEYDLVVWPETAVPFVLREEPGRARAIREALAAKGAALLAGISDKRANAAAAGRGDDGGGARSRAEKIKESAYRKVNTVHLVRPDTDRLETYEKLHLVPFGEYVPPFLGLLEDMMMDVGAGIFVPGDAARTFRVPLRGGAPVEVGAVICLESNFPQLVREFVDRGARALVVVANDEWYAGTTEMHQHAAIARLRAVEYRLPVLRSSNGGISAIIDPAGRVVAAAEPGVEAIVSGAITPGAGASFYARHGDWLPWAALAASLAVLAWAAASTLAARKGAR